MNLLYFVLLASGLVLVHEFGHFLVARIVGVRVLTFSIGFGPAILRYRGKETTYQLALVPLGGFVRLLEAADGEALEPYEAARSFDKQSVLKRAFIAIAGPAMNVLVAFFVLFGVASESTSDAPPLIGIVHPGTPAASVLRAGDRVIAVDGQPVATFQDVSAAVARHRDSPVKIRISRLQDPFAPLIRRGREDVLDVVIRPLEVGRSARMGVGPAPALAAIYVRPDSPAYRAGLRTFDVVTHVSGHPTRLLVDLEKRFASNPGASVPVNFLRPQAVAVGDSGLVLGRYEAGVAMVAPDTSVKAEGDPLDRAGIESSDRVISYVAADSPFAAAGLLAGDRLVTLDGEKIASFQAFLDAIETRPGSHRIGFLRGAETRETHVDRNIELSRAHDFGPGIAHWVPTLPEPRVESEPGVFDRGRDAFRLTVDIIGTIGSSFARIVTGDLDLRTLSGPLGLYQLAGEAGARGARDFLWLLALVSMQLGLLNLLPVPTLDGGLLLLLVLEKIVGRPLPVRVRGALSVVGLVALLALMAVALVNDVQKRGW